MVVSVLRPALKVFVLTVSLCTSASAAAPYPRSVPGTSLTLMDAVELTLRQNPGLQIAELGVEIQAGIVQEERGQFDPELRFNATLEYREEQLSQRERQGQVDQRRNLQTVIDQLAVRVTDRRTILDEVIAIQQDPASGRSSAPEIQSQLDLLNELILSAPSPDTRAELERLRDDWLQRRRNEVQDAVETLQDLEASERERLQKLGDVPEINMSYFSNFDVAWRVPYRNGNVATWFADLSHDGANFRGKPRDAEFGGKGIIDVYKSRLGVRLDIPLGQGSGRSVVTAFEQAAEQEWRAQQHRLTHQAAAAVRQTAEAYWALVAAQMNRDVIAESARRQQRLVELADILIRADLLPAVEIGRARAREADAGAALISAEDRLRSARLRLADSIGLEVADESLAPLAADAFPQVQALPEAAELPLVAWTEQALGQRQDLMASQRNLSTARLLERSAEMEKRSRHDLQFEVFASGLEETSSVRAGFDGAMTEKWVFPSARLGYSYSRPRNNDVAIGRWRQASATRRQEEISDSELGRRIRSNVLETALRLNDAAERAEFAERAIELYRQAIENERDKIEMGSATVIDIILTEERLTQAALALIASRQNYASTLASLRFETASLLQQDETGYQLQASALLSPPAIEH